MTLVLVGDSHLARVRRASILLETDVRNLAVGGSTILDMSRQLDLLESEFPPDHPSPPVLLSIGANDSAARRGVTLGEFSSGLAKSLARLRGRPVAFVAPPRVIESRPAGQYWANDRVDAYREAALAVARAGGAALIRADEILAPLGKRAFQPDGLHLNGLGYRTLLPHLAPTAWSESDPRA